MCANSVPGGDGDPARDGSLGDPWLDRLPGVVAGALMRRRIAEQFRSSMRGELHTYAEEHDLQVHLLRPERRRREPDGCRRAGPREEGGGCVVFLHGGGWLGGAPSQFYPYARVVSGDFGATVALCEFRSALSHPGSRVPMDSVADASRCVRYVQDRAEEFGIDRSKVVLAGASSGGQVAAMTALGSPGLQLSGLVLFNPVLDMHFSEAWWQRSPMVWLGYSLLRLRHCTAELDAHSPLQRVRQLPYPTVILHGTSDNLVPIREAESFADEMRKCGNSCTLVPFPEQGHYFFNWRVSLANFHKCLDHLRTFLVSVGVSSSPGGGVIA